MSNLPEFVYLVQVEGEWPVSAIADDHPSTPARIENEVRRRTSAASPPRSITHAHVFRAGLSEITEIELVPSHHVDAVIQPKEKS